MPAASTTAEINILPDSHGVTDITAPRFRSSRRRFRESDCEELCFCLVVEVAFPHLKAKSAQASRTSAVGLLKDDLPDGSPFISARIALDSVLASPFASDRNGTPLKRKKRETIVEHRSQAGVTEELDSGVGSRV